MRKILAYPLVILGSILFDTARLLYPELVSGLFTRYFKKNIDEAGLTLVKKSTFYANEPLETDGNK